MVDLYTIIETKEDNDNFGIRVKPNSDEQITISVFNNVWQPTGWF